MKREFESIWDDLRGKKPSYGSFLNAVNIDGLRGLKDLTVRFGYPVSVIAGENASGKSTVLFSLACAYQMPDDRDSWHLRPAQVFPVLTPRVPNMSHDDWSSEATLAYSYQGSNEGYGYESDDKVVATQMRWRRRAERWRYTFFGLDNAIQPPKEVYRRALSNISSPSERRSLLFIHRAHETVEIPVDHELIQLAERVLPFEYEKITKISSPRIAQPLLFAVQKDKTAYSEFQMSAGERAVLNISQEVSKLNNALVLIDEVDAGLHPYLQELLMLRLQELALRNELQIVVTTHSEAVINSVPREARIFLSRNSDNHVEVVEPHRDIIQNALYRRPHDTIFILCEDNIAEGVIRGIFDRITPELGIRVGRDVHIGRDTGVSQFKSHYDAVAKFGMERNFLFILDGDAKNNPEAAALIEKMLPRPALPTALTLPGKEAPEAWLLEMLKSTPERYVDILNQDIGQLKETLQRKEQLYAGASSTPREKIKATFNSFCEELDEDPEVVARRVASKEAKVNPEMIKLTDDIIAILELWRRND